MVLPNDSAAKAASISRAAVISSLTMLPTGIPVQSETIAATPPHPRRVQQRLVAWNFSRVAIALSILFAKLRLARRSRCGCRAGGLPDWPSLAALLPDTAPPGWLQARNRPGGRGPC